MSRKKRSIWAGLCEIDLSNRQKDFDIWYGSFGVLLLFGYAFFKLPYIEVARVFLGLMVLGFFVSFYKSSMKIRNEPVYLLMIGSVVLSMMLFLIWKVQIPNYAEKSPSVDNFLNLFLFLPVAWWLSGSLKNVFRLYLISLISFFGFILANGGINDYIDGMGGERVLFSMRSQHASMFFSVFLIGWLIFSLRFIGWRVKKFNFIRLALWVLVFVPLFVGFIVTQTRAAWLGTSVSLLVVLGVLFFYKSQFSRKTLAGVAAAVLALMVLSFNLDFVKNRIQVETNVVEKVISNDFDDVPYTPVGIRINLWLEALTWIEKRPITGWGYDARSRVIDESERLPSWVIEQFGHFHNSYIEYLLSYGVLGVLFISSIFILVIYRTWKTWKEKQIPSDLLLFGISFTIFWLIVNVFESYFLWSTGVYMMALIAGSLYTFSISYQMSRKAIG